MKRVSTIVSVYLVAQLVNSDRSNTLLMRISWSYFLGKGEVVSIMTVCAAADPPGKDRRVSEPRMFCDVLFIIMAAD